MSFRVRWLREGVLLCQWPERVDLLALEASFVAHDALLKQHIPRPYWAIHEAADGLPNTNAAQRKRIGEWLGHEKTRTHRSIRGAVIVTPSPIVRGMVTAVHWVANPNYLWKTFATREEAMAFIDASG